ncbi:MAG: sulfotransferase-like domain-containing protein [Shimia sp.]
MRIAMWSGPRNLSTAMMYSFAQRPGCRVVDEPFYAAWLAASGADHPMRAECLTAQPQDPVHVIEQFQPLRADIVYEKQMTHHILRDWPLDWMAARRNVFLIRHPARVIASYAAKHTPTWEEIGFEGQAWLYEEAVERGLDPLVIDSDDILADPAGMLRALCAALGIPFHPEMLHWPRGPKPYDGAWAPHWYDAIHRSTGFGPAPGALPDVREHAALMVRALPIYERLKAVSL